MDLFIFIIKNENNYTNNKQNLKYKKNEINIHFILNLLIRSMQEIIQKLNNQMYTITHSTVVITNKLIIIKDRKVTKAAATASPFLFINKIQSQKQ